MVTGIQAAHNQHIIHRDIKPAEYHHFQRRKSKGDGFRDRAGDDFDEHRISTNVMGSVHYTSPEQARAEL